MSDINWWAVLLATVASMVIGSLWYGPLFGKMFMKVSGMDKWTPEERAAAQKAMMTSYFLQFIASLVMFYVLAHIINSFDGMTVAGGITGALWVWLGFIVPVKLADTLWGGNRTLSFLTMGNMLVTLVVAGAIIGGMH
jgi:hypothetical protein